MKNTIESLDDIVIYPKRRAFKVWARYAPSRTGFCVGIFPTLAEAEEFASQYNGLAAVSYGDCIANYFGVKW